MPAPSESEVRGYLKTLSNWGRWGSEDELGTINLITPAKRQAAARLVSHGQSVTCARPITTDITPDTTVQPMRFMVDSGEGRDTVSPERALQRRGAAEFIGMVFHGYTITHVDAPSHYFWEGQLYNGRSCNAVTSREGATVNSVEVLRDGVVSRGVLLDVARTRGVRWLEGGVGVMPEDLEAAEQAAGVRVEAGDILLVRTGYYGRCRKSRSVERRGFTRMVFSGFARWIASCSSGLVTATGTVLPPKAPRGAFESSATLAARFALRPSAPTVSC